MTLARPQRKSSTAIAAALILAAVAAPAARAQITERIITNRYSGLAIDGYDPVAYFVDAKAEVGRGGEEFRHAGVVWRFRNPGNRAAFINTPELYVPAYGGYDPVAIARGVALPGNPTLWIIAGGRLYFFSTAAAREDFHSAPAKAVTAANAEWPQVMAKLVAR